MAPRMSYALLRMLTKSMHLVSSASGQTSTFTTKVAPGMLSSGMAPAKPPCEKLSYSRVALPPSFEIKRPSLYNLNTNASPGYQCLNHSVSFHSGSNVYLVILVRQCGLEAGV